MHVTRFCLCLLILRKFYATQSEGLAQPFFLITAQLGDAVTLQCFFGEGKKTDIMLLYKQALGQIPQRILSAVKYMNDVTLYSDFKDNPRITAHKSDDEILTISISNTQPSDSAIYYCGKMYTTTMEFESRTFVILQGSESHSRTVVLQQPESESVQPGDSVTLQCTVHTETCAGEHSVYWFRQGSGESPPGIIYTHGNRSDECQRSSGAVSPTQSCVYSFPKRNLSPSDAGTYYCAVAICGEVLFGNGTKLDVDGNESLLRYCLVAVLTLSVILNIVLTLNRRKSNKNCKEPASENQVPRDDLLSEQCQDETLNYVALTFTSKKPKVKRNKREVEKEMIYSDMRLKDCQ